MVEHIEIDPDKKLGKYIDKYWISTGYISDQPINYTILPDCCNDIIFNLGDTVRSLSNTSDLTKNKPYFVGMATRYSKIEISGFIFLIGIRFKPLGLNAFTKKIDYKACKNQTAEINFMSADEVFNGKFPDVQEVKPHLDMYLLKHLNPDYSTNKHLSNAITTINQGKGIIGISELSESVNTSVRNLERLFSYNIGITPKEFTKMTRLIHAKKSILRFPNKDLGQIAYDFNYYDQAHFSRDFFNFAGKVPSSFC